MTKATTAFHSKKKKEKKKKQQPEQHPLADARPRDAARGDAPFEKYKEDAARTAGGHAETAAIVFYADAGGG